MKHLTDAELAQLLDTPIFHQIGEVADHLGMECYVVGGFVRDLFLERPSKDIDCLVVGSGIQVAEELAKRLGRGAHISVFRNFGTAQVKYKGQEIEFVGARKESYSHDSRKPIVEDGTLDDDLDRRDFTINALAVCLNRERYGQLVDNFNGLMDLEDGIIATPLDPDITFSDDPLRMMRCIRFSTQLNFLIEEDTELALTRNAERIKIISQERIIDELNKIMLSPSPSIGFVEMSRSGLLPIIFPELAAMEGVEVRNGRAHKDNFYHTLEVLDNVCHHGGERATLWLRWAALLHDIGKPRSKKWENGVGWTFHNHNYIGQKMVPTIFRRMKLPTDERMAYVAKLVGLHMRPIAIADEEVTDSAVRRLLFEAGEDIEDLMILCEADITSRNQQKKQRFLDNFQLVRQKLADLQARDNYRTWQNPITGEEIMETFGLSPCKEIGIL
ncbi:MAG: HD domain-containing protein, partial [Paraprevotella sp.]|nr:HD domain-containing protein [Paraprevotella sp.]